MTEKSPKMSEIMKKLRTGPKKLTRKEVAKKASADIMTIKHSFMQAVSIHAIYEAVLGPLSPAFLREVYTAMTKDERSHKGLSDQEFFAFAKEIAKKVSDEGKIAPILTGTSKEILDELKAKAPV